ncbi:SET domain-containing protein 3 [Yamadazyma tenuis]|uniref:SET domain-containing protein 3 n=1 Tax=Candida tenuis TaxID=2315449 RepID=UPI00279A4355|nr:SET domain-containing protein 3 [Yamadazyma tenuis]
MAHRLIMNVIFTGASVFGRAFTEAYKQAAKVSASSAANSVAKSQSIGGIPVDESLKILDLDRKELSLDKVDEKYKYLFEVNSKEKGNSFYLQSKVYYAMDTLRKELDYLERLKEDKKKGTAALAQAADNPLPLLKHEEAVRREIKHEVIKSPVVADKAGVKTEKKPEVPEQEPVVPKSEPVVHKQEHVVHKQEHVVHKQEHVVHKQEHVVPGKKPEIPEVVAPTPHNDDKPLVSKDYVAPPLSEYKVEPDSGVIGCICGISDDDGFTIQCDICYRWQHCLCMDYSTNEEVPEDEYKCYFCDKEKWGKFDPEQCRHNTVTRLQQDNDNQDVSTSKPGNKRKVSTSGRVGDKKKSRLNPNQERPKDRRKQLRDDFSNPTSAVDEIPDFIPNEDNELLDDGYTAESYQSTYYKLRSNDYLNHQSQKHFEDLGDRFYDSFQQLSEDEKEKLNIEVVTLKNFKAIPRMYVKLPNHETHMQAHNKPIKIPNVYIQVKQYSDSQKQKFNGISKLSLFVQAQREGSKEAFEDLIPKGTPILEYFGVLNEFSQYRDNKPNQYNVWGTTKPKVLKTSLSFIDKGKQIKDFDVVLDSRFVGNETRFIRKACPPAANCEVKAFYIPEAKSFRFLVVTSKDIKLDQETSEEELRLPWEWDEAHPIRKMYGDESKNIEGLKFDQLSDKEKTLLITTIDNLLYFTECGCSTTTNTPSYLPNCAVFKVRKAISYLLRATRKVSGIINVNMYKPKDELIIPKEPKTYVPWEQRLHNREEFIQTKLFVPTPTKVIKFDDDEEVSRDTIKDIIIKNQLVKLTDNSVEVIDGKYHNDKVLDLVPISTGISAKVEKTVEAEVQVKPEIKKSLSELKLKLTDNNLTKINKVLNLNLEKRVTPPPIPAEPSEKPMVKKKLSFADYKKKMK